MQNVSHIALAAWIVIIPILFTRMDKTRAVLIAVIVGWLFLPELQMAASWHEVPAPLGSAPIFLTKTNAICYGLLVGILFLDARRLGTFRFQWFDLPILLWCAAPFFSTTSNGLKIGIVVMETVRQTLTWGVPYFVGRLYFADFTSFRALAIGFLLGGLVYLPFCILEVRLSPKSHLWIWGFYQHDPRQAERGSLYRPVVFLEHGLAVGMWMAGVALLAFWMWWTRALDELKWLPGFKPVPMAAFIAVLLVTCVLMGSAGALGLGLVGAGVLVLSRWLPVPLGLAALMVLPPMYCVGRTMSNSKAPTGYLNSSRTQDELDILDRRAMAKPLFGFSSLTGEQLHQFLESSFNKQRADSFQTRLVMEDRLMEQALQRPGFGWGGEGRSRFKNPHGDDISITDGLWIMVFGDRGFFGLAALGLVLLLPTARLMWTYPQKLWSHPALAPAAALAVVQVLTLVDDLSNAMINMLFIVANGALAGLIGTPLPRPGAVQPQSVAAIEPEPRDETAPAEPELPGVLRRRLPSSSRRQSGR